MARLALEIGQRAFRFGDPYFACPHCSEAALYTGKNGTCYSCGLDFIVSQPKPKYKITEDTKDWALLATAIGLATLTLWATGRGKPTT